MTGNRPKRNSKPKERTTMSHADSIDASALSLRAIFPGTLNAEAHALINQIIRQCDPPIRVVQESTWALKLGGLRHCTVCLNVRGVRVGLTRERQGRCEEHAEWKIFYRHHAWDVFEHHEAAIEYLKGWLAESSQRTENPADPGTDE